MPKVCHLDIESFSEADLKKGGTYVYAEHPSTELLCVGYAFDDGPVTVWIPDSNPERYEAALAYARERVAAEDRFIVSSKVPEDLRQHIESGGQVRAHNAAFERTVLNGVAGQKVNFPHIKIEQCVCTAAKCRAMGLPGSLGDAASALGTRPKNKFGGNIMLQLCRPRAGEVKRYLPENEPEKYGALLAYNVDDVYAEKDIDDALPDLTAAEQAVWELDQRINDKGWKVDLAAIADIQAVVAEYKDQLEKLCLSWCGFRPSQREKIAAWVREQGYPQLIDMTADSVRQAVKDAACPEAVKNVLRLYSTYGMKAVTKLESMVNMACADGRLRGLFLFHGAGTGRWSSMGVQAQNLARPSIKDVDTAISLFKDRDLEWIKMMYPVDVMKVASSCIRGMFVPEEGHDMMAIDLAGIESRLTAWVFGEDWKIAAFAAKDAGTGPDTYRLAYARAFGVPVESVTGAQRQIGKVLELALGYEGGVGAFLTMAPNYGVDLNELAETAYPNIPSHVLDQAYNSWEWAVQTKRTNDLDQKVYIVIQSLVIMWRESHPAHVAGWQQMREAAIAAVENEGKPFKIDSGLIVFKVIVYKGRKWLFMRLPSGRRIAYYDPTVEYVVGKPPKGFVEEAGRWVLKNDAGAITESMSIPPPRKTLRYMGVDTNTRRWMRVGTYGGRLTQNGPGEGIARDLLVNGLQKLEAAGYRAVGSIHDEGVFEPPSDHGSLEAAREIFLDAPAWAKNLPLSAEGFRAARYRK